ncbi:MAG: peptidase, partial [Adhaeribacter sp.]|nr:peptidase [Adhaeribacter sp.]
MKEKHIILRLARSATRDLFLGGAIAKPTDTESLAAGLSVEIEEIDRNQITTLSRHSDVVAIAPSIPMKLIQPVSVANFAVPAASEVAWGVKAVGADTSPFSGSGIVVAVLDTGIDAAHPAFAGMSIIQNDFTGEGSADQHGHGTHCAGTIFGRTTGNMRIGVAPGIEKALIGKVLGEKGGSSEQIISAMQWAVDNGANVISMSLGMDFPGLVKRLIDDGFPPELATSRALEGYRTNVQLFDRLVAYIQAKASFSQPTVIVAAAGNESNRDTNPDFEIAVSPPAVAEGIISVAALGESTKGFTVAPFSNTGATVS